MENVEVPLPRDNVVIIRADSERFEGEAKEDEELSYFLWATPVHYFGRVLCSMAALPRKKNLDFTLFTLTRINGADIILTGSRGRFELLCGARWWCCRSWMSVLLSTFRPIRLICAGAGSSSFFAFLLSRVRFLLHPRIDQELFTTH